MLVSTIVVANLKIEWRSAGEWVLNFCWLSVLVIRSEKLCSLTVNDYINNVLIHYPYERSVGRQLLLIMSGGKKTKPHVSYMNILSTTFWRGNVIDTLTNNHKLRQHDKNKWTKTIPYSSIWTILLKLVLDIPWHHNLKLMTESRGTVVADIAWYCSFGKSNSNSSKVLEWK